MKIAILIPHWRSGRTTAYCVSQVLKHKGDHELNIIICDNDAGDGSVDYLRPFEKDITVINYPKDRLQSHGVALDYILASGLVNTEYFITMESDSFPICSDWIDRYAVVINDGFECGGSRLRLSGGEYLHPCGAFYKTSLWHEVKKHCDTAPYYYFPNMSRKSGFDNHLMVHRDIINDFLCEPEDFIELAEGYKPYYAKMAEEKSSYYSPVKGPFHNGMGCKEESLQTYGQRTIESEAETVMWDNKRKMYNRLGAEPGQFISWYAAYMKKRIYYAPTKIRWMPGKENQQQEYTISDFGIKHLWCGSSFLSMKDTAMHDVYEFKKNQIDQLYNSLPENQKIKE